MQLWNPAFINTYLPTNAKVYLLPLVAGDNAFNLSAFSGRLPQPVPVGKEKSKPLQIYLADPFSVISSSFDACKAYYMLCELEGGTFITRSTSSIPGPRSKQQPASTPISFSGGQPESTAYKAVQNTYHTTSPTSPCWSRFTPTSTTTFVPSRVGTFGNEQNVLVQKCSSASTLPFAVSSPFPNLPWTGSTPMMKLPSWPSLKTALAFWSTQSLKLPQLPPHRPLWYYL